MLGGLERKFICRVATSASIMQRAGVCVCVALLQPKAQHDASVL